MQTTSFGSNAIKFGLFIGLFNIVLSLIYYVFDVNMFSTGFMIGNIVLSLIIVISFFVFGIKSYRNTGLAGKITFLQAFTQGIAIGIIAYLIIGVYQYVFTAYIAPDYMASQLEKFIDFMEGFGMPDEALDAAVEEFKKNLPPAKAMLAQFKNGGIMTVIVSLLIAAFIKKDTTEATIA